MQNSFFRTAALTTFLSGPIGLASLCMVFGAYNWDFDTAFNPLKAIAYQPDPGPALRLGWLLDILGFYLLLAPAVFYLQHHFSEKAPLYARLFTFFGLGYILFGGMGAAIMSGTSESIFSSWQIGDPAQKAAVATVFTHTYHQIFDGIWNLYAMLMAGVWLTGMGWLICSEQRWLGRATCAIGVACLLDFLGMALKMEGVSTIGLNIYLWLEPLWAVWLGITIWKSLKSADAAAV